MEIKRDSYLNALINRMHNGMIKVVTGVRRSGKSYLIFHIFRDYLLAQGVTASHIISVALDQRKYRRYRDDPDALLDDIEAKCDGRRDVLHFAGRGADDGGF